MTLSIYYHSRSLSLIIKACSYTADIEKGGPEYLSEGQSRCDMLGIKPLNNKNLSRYKEGLKCYRISQEARDWTHFQKPKKKPHCRLNSLKERFDPLHKESQPGYRVIDDFADRIFFFPCNRNDSKERELHLNKLDYLCQNALEQPNSIVVVTDASVKPNKSFQAVSVTYGWCKGIQVISSKAAFGSITAPNAKLVAIRLGIVKATSLDVDRIVVITDSLSSARKALDPHITLVKANPLPLHTSFDPFSATTVTIR